MRELKENKVRRLDADESRQQEQQPAVITSAEHVVPINTAPYTSEGVLLSLPEDAGRSELAGPTSPREFERTSGASSEV